MKLTRNISIIAVAIGMMAALTSCDEVSKGDRYKELPAVEMQRVVLLEEFTGQFCVNCPNAHKIVASLVEQYPDNLIAVSIHSGGDAFSLGEEDSDDEVMGLRLAEGENYATMMGISALPAGVVNRTSGVQTMNQWAATIRTELERPSDLEIKLAARLSDDGSQIIVDTELTSYENLSGRLQLWVTESGIKTLQMLPNGDIEWDYEHNHVFRGTINGQQGEAIDLIIREPQKLSHTIAVKDLWNTDNVSVVGFVYNQSGVIQAAETHLGGDHEAPAQDE